MDWRALWAEIDPTVDEPNVCIKFVPLLLESLGFGPAEQVIQFSTEHVGGSKVDFAARKNTAEDTFSVSRKEPFLLLEAKGRCTQGGIPINLAENTPQYVAARKQIKGYLLSPKGKTARWGIITNATHIQLFKHHSKVVTPVTRCIELTEENIEDVISGIRKLIHSPPRSLNVCVYNNKGGVGKTTTTINLASALATQKKRVLLVDFDSQRDLTTALGLEPSSIQLSECLKDRSLDIRSAVVPYKVIQGNGRTAKVFHPFDVIPSDLGMEAFTQQTQSRIERGAARLRDLLKPFSQEYDYIFIDCPTQWLFFSKSGVYASDVVLIPTRHNDLASLHNAARVIQEFVVKEVKELRQDGGPVALPIFFNGSPSDGRSIDMAREEIEKIIEKVKSENNFDLTSYFFPKKQPGNIDKTIFNLPSYAIVANAAFARVPAVFKNRNVLGYYLELAREYFLDD